MEFKLFNSSKCKCIVCNQILPVWNLNDLADAIQGGRFESNLTSMEFKL